MPDKYNVEIRRIKEEDKYASFKTHHKDFDKCNPSGTLAEYWQSDSQSSGKFDVYLLLEANTKSPIGILRVRNEIDGADPTIPELNNQPAIYLSRVGLLTSRRNYHLGRILLEYFFFIAKSEIKSHSLKKATGYLKCIDNERMIGYYESFGGKVIKKYTGPWGPAVVMAINLCLSEDSIC
jgi:hypothetical protein